MANLGRITVRVGSSLVEDPELVDGRAIPACRDWDSFSYCQSGQAGIGI